MLRAATSVLLLLAAFVPTVISDAVELPSIPPDLSTPVQQRLAYNGATGMFVAWNTYEQLSQPTVKYGTSASALDLTAQSTHSVTYPTSRTWANIVLLSGLTPATTYYYQIQSTNSSIDTFTTARTAGDQTPFSFALVIDLGLVGKYGYTAETGTGQKTGKPVPVPPALTHSTIESLVNYSSSYQFVLHPGDLAYADDWILGWAEGIDPGDPLNSGPIYEGLTELFYDQLAYVSRMRPYMVGPGNHEADCDEVTLVQFLCPKGQENFTAYRNHFTGGLPLAPDPPAQSAMARWLSPEHIARSFAASTAASLSNPPFWYSFDYGMAHFVVFDTETDIQSGVAGPEEKGGSGGLDDGPFGGPNQQINFLKADLASVDRSITPWIIAAGHRPWYSTGTEHCYECQAAFEPIFNQYNVDVVALGHVHNMQQLVPMANNQTDPAGLNNPTSPWYIINGAAGNIEGRSAIGANRPSYVAWANDVDYGYSIVNIFNRTHLEVQYIRSDDGVELNSAVLYKAH